MSANPTVRDQLRVFFCALGYFTRIPIPAWVGYQAGDLDRAARYFPLVGGLVGLIAAVVFGLAHWLWPLRVALLLSTLATVYLTGAFHEDGLADSVDGWVAAMNAIACWKSCMTRA